MTESCIVPLDASLLRTDFVPSDAQSIPIRAAIVSQRKAIADIDSNISELERQIEELYQQREAESNALDIKEAFLAPVRRLAPEILGKVFEYCLSDKLEETLPMDAPLLMMRVSHNWREVAQETPRLWIQIAINSWTTMPHVSMWIKNSGSLPLDIALDLRDIRTDTTPEVSDDEDGWHVQGWAPSWDDEASFTIPVDNLAVLHILIQQLARIRRFELNCPYSILRLLFPKGKERKMASLEELVVCCSKPPFFNVVPSHDAYHMEDTLLHTLTLHQNALVIISIKPTSSLRVLKLLGHQPLTQLLKFLEFCPGLEELIAEDIHLSGDEERDSQHLEPDPIILSNLWNLELGWGQRGSGWGRNRRGPHRATSGRFLRSLRVPQARNVALQNFPGEIDELCHFFTGCASSLRQLSLNQLSCNSYQFYRILKGLKEVETLSLNTFKVVGGIWEPLIPEADSPPNMWLCPKLHSLKSLGSNCQEEDLQVVEFVRRRSAPIAQLAGGPENVPHGFHHLRNITLDEYDYGGEIFSMLRDLQSQGHDFLITNPRDGRGHRWGGDVGWGYQP